jgi:hypothetical protein
LHLQNEINTFLLKIRSTGITFKKHNVTVMRVFLLSCACFTNVAFAQSEKDSSALWAGDKVSITFHVNFPDSPPRAIQHQPDTAGAGIQPGPLTVLLPGRQAKVRRGRSISIQWHGTHQAQSVEIHVLRGNDKPVPLGEVEGKTSFVWTVPRRFKKGEATIQLTAGEQTALSEPFRIKRRTPLGLLILPPLAVGGVLFVLSDTPAGNNDLPEPPAPR